MRGHRNLILSKKRLDMDRITGKWKSVFVLLFVLFAVSSAIRVSSTSVVTVNAGTGQIHTVTFNPEGGTVNVTSQGILYGQPIEYIPTPVRDGFMFVQWYYYVNDGEKIEYNKRSLYEGMDIRSDIQAYAEWHPLYYRFVIDFNGGYVGASSRITKDLKFYDPIGELPIPKRDGYQFMGYYTQISGGSRVTESTIITSSRYLRFYARWKPLPYTIVFQVNGGNKLPASQVKRKRVAGQVYGTLPNATRRGHRFLGWYVKNEYGNLERITKNSRLKNVKSTTVYARWQLITVRVTFVPGSGAGYSRLYKELSYGRRISLPQTAYFLINDRDMLLNPVRYGYLFTGWRVGSTRGPLFSFTRNSTYTKNIVVYGTWKRATADQIARYIALKAKKKTGAYYQIREATHLARLYVARSYYTYTAGYNMPRGLFVTGRVTCAGVVRGLGLVLTKMGYKWKHINPNKYTHQWNVVVLPGRDILADSSIGRIGYLR